MGSEETVAKISRPRIGRTVPRERLYALLDAACEQRVLWVSGPPGAGKTSLVVSYLEHRKRRGIWYQVDSGDADLASFFFYLGEAGRSRRRAALPLLTPEYLLDLSGFTRRFFRALMQHLPRPAVLVLDNFQEAPGPMLAAIVRDAAVELVDGVTLIIVSRHEPPEDFARLRVNQQMAVLGWDDLRFNADESTALVALRGAASPEFAMQAHLRSGGWAAGLRLLAEGAASSGVPPVASALNAPPLFQQRDPGPRFRRDATAVALHGLSPKLHRRHSEPAQRHRAR